MNFEVIDQSRQILLNGIPVEALVSASAFFVAIISILIAIRSSRETARANILSHLPVISLDFDGKADKVIIKNIGKSTAVDIVLDKYYNWSADDNFEIFGRSTLVFEKINLLEAGKSITVNHKVKGLRDVLGVLTFTIFSKHSKKIDFIVKFRDISGKKYYTVVRISQSKVEVRVFPRGVGLKTLLTLARYKTIQFFLSIVYFVIVKTKKYKHIRNKKKKQNTSPKD